MELGIGIDGTLGLTWPETRALATEAAAQGYRSAWTPSGGATRDGFQVCGQWAAAFEAAGAMDARMGIAVIPAPVWSIGALAHQAGSLGDLSGGRFILGLGTGGSYSADYRAMYGLGEAPIVAMMRDYLVVLRRLFAGETVTYKGPYLSVQGLKVTERPIDVPLYISALGPQMLRLAGELADGVCLNWTTPAHRRWCRDRIAEGAARAKRDPAAVTLMEYIRVCVDDDPVAAKRAFGAALLGYAMARPGASADLGYRGHFTRMGFDEPLKRIEAMRDAGAPLDDLVAAIPDEMAALLGYHGGAAGAREAFRRVAEHLDTAEVRIVPAKQGVAAAQATMEAFAPRG
jgi:alkanesulfonate monooxygenase SsuD/methylene tetrahydromethanopterin reductase-like flavin-dependent oxidoreductase (luciferase family)